MQHRKATEYFHHRDAEFSEKIIRSQVQIDFRRHAGLNPERFRDRNDRPKKDFITNTPALRVSAVNLPVSCFL
jgi:hypothetical protein